MNASMPFRVLTIAGSDSGGGAGIQADLKTFFSLGVYGMSAVTAITVQNTQGVGTVLPVPPDMVAAQITACVTDIGVDAAKTGMLWSPGIVMAVADTVRRLGIPRLVVDPVLAAKDGSMLLIPAAVDAMRLYLLPAAHVVTPNVPEAAMLAGMEITGLHSVREAARRIHALGVPWVVIKGGHLPTPEEAIDTVFDGQEFYHFRNPRIGPANGAGCQGVCGGNQGVGHGTGCTFSAALAALLAKGFTVPRAVEAAKGYVTAALAHGLRLGMGCGPVNHWAGWEESKGAS